MNGGAARREKLLQRVSFSKQPMSLLDCLGACAERAEVGCLGLLVETHAFPPPPLSGLV